MKNNYIVQAWLVLLLAVFYGGALAGVQLTLSPKILENKINETRQQVPGLVLGADRADEAIEMESTTLALEKNGRQVFYDVYKAMQNGEPAGWVIKSSGQGYADKIELLVGVNPDLSAITGLFILNQKETPGLGNKIIEDDWRNQFLQKKTDKSLAVVKTGAKAGNEIDAITGATISSRAVCTIINSTLNDVKGQLSTVD
ncbi:RnfABCDGE type electron transport complex subunit G [Desulfosudis oleivorans]|uniref:Ion-translocating oxidoreductase complex subunit G n=1 Tax=Desulfosudis oleivorans (strain DSM 6200 / JCM 39069 / Hxd3) TaxID=96561 RepID=A8ZSV4_DESOH|nr:RnfABCDGE type electron transport complex subunit G [Desulfosudis oleivorans]ABW66118.1 FMN-binding domain protein [Desulfosudis oleivorans Hxd3]